LARRDPIAYIQAKVGARVGARAFEKGAAPVLPMGLSIWHVLIIIVVVAVLFGGKGKLSGIMGDAAKGIRAFKDGLKGEDDHAKPAATIPHQEAEKEDVRR
jgi:sec-independent protein translocase protein TatA